MAELRAVELKAIVSAVSERDVSEFGTVRPRVQIPGPDQIDSTNALSYSAQRTRYPKMWCRPTRIGKLSGRDLIPKTGDGLGAAA